MNTSMTASDIFVVLRELRELIVGRWILNIYQLNGTLLFKISHDSPNKIWLVIEPGKRIHLTTMTYEQDARIRAFTKSLRKHLRDHKISALEQHDFDRVVYLRAGPPERQFTIVIELFGGGNAILLDPKNRIVDAMTYRRMRDRDIVRGAPFEFPPLRAQDPIHSSEEELNTILETSQSDTIRALIRGYNVSSMTTEQILAKAKIDAGLPAKELIPKQKRTLFQSMREYFETLANGELTPQIHFDEEGNPKHVLPLKSHLKSIGEIKEYPTFNEALDIFFSAYHKEETLDSLDEHYQKEKTKLQQLKEKQQQHLEVMQTRAAQSRTFANAIYQQLPVVEELLSSIRDARDQKLSWDEINQRITIGKKKEIPAAAIFERIDPQSGRVYIVLQTHSITLDYRLTAAENANRMFQRSKKLEKKVNGAQIAINDTKAKLAQLEEKREKELVKSQAQIPTQRRKKHWFEKFRWFKTSQGLLVLGGRDAISNQQLVRKHLTETDLFFHADVKGAPVVILKTPSEDVLKADLEETAIFAISYSRIWKAGWSNGDAYWVRSDQVSLSAPTGEFLPKGGVMVRGKRNYLHNLPVQIGVGLLLEDEMPVIAAGPMVAIKNQTQYVIGLIPGKTKISDIAKQIRAYFAKKVQPEMRQKVKAINIDEVIAVLPPGSADIEKKYLPG